MTRPYFEDQNSFLNLKKLDSLWVNLDWIYLGKNGVGPKYIYVQTTIICYYFIMNLLLQKNVHLV
jgi:hypothetical protein